MSISDDIKYNITMQAKDTLTYEDGFAEGYSRAWQECWDFMIEKMNEDSFKKEKPEPEAKS